MLIASHMTVLLVVGALVAWGRFSLTRTRLNRQLIYIAVFLQVGSALLALFCRGLGLPLPTAMVVQQFFWFAVAAMTALTLDPDLLPTVGAYVVSLVVLGYDPGLRYYAMALCNLAFVLNVALTWRQARPNDRAPRFDPLAPRPPRGEGGG